MPDDQCTDFALLDAVIEQGSGIGFRVADQLTPTPAIWNFTGPAVNDCYRIGRFVRVVAPPVPYGGDMVIRHARPVCVERS